MPGAHAQESPLTRGAGGFQCKDRQDARNMLLAIPGAQELFEKETPNDSPSVEPPEVH